MWLENVLCPTILKGGQKGCFRIVGPGLWLKILAP